MKTIYSLLIAGCLIVPGAASAQTAPAADATGTWTASFNTQNGVIPATLKLQKSGDKMTGTIGSQEGTSEVEAEVKGKTLTVRFNYNANGQAMPIVMTGTLDGDSAKGTMTAGGNAAGDWTATREKDTKETKEPAPSTPSAPSLTGVWTEGEIGRAHV